MLIAHLTSVKVSSVKKSVLAGMPKLSVDNALDLDVIGDLGFDAMDCSYRQSLQSDSKARYVVQDLIGQGGTGNEALR